MKWCFSENVNALEPLNSTVSLVTGTKYTQDQASQCLRREGEGTLEALLLAEQLLAVDGPWGTLFLQKCGHW